MGELLDDPDALRPQEVAEGAEGLSLVLDHLVGSVADAGIFDRHAREGRGVLRLVERPRERGHRLVDPGLGRVREGVHGRASAADQGGDDRLGAAFEGFGLDFGRGVGWGFD